MLTAQVQGIRIIPASSCYNQGIPGRSTATFVKNGKVHRRNGFGGERVYSSTRLVLEVVVNGMIEDVFVDGLFRSEMDRLTEKRIAAICRAIPASVQLEKCESFNGNIFYILTEASFWEWFRNVKW